MSGDGSRRESGEEDPCAARQRVVVGRIRGAHGVRGALRVQPFTEARDTLLSHPVWMVGRGDRWSEYRLTGGTAHGDSLRATLEGVADRDAAEALRGHDIAIWREALPALPEGEYYWSDLEGLTVETCEGATLGRVERLMETGANDVLVVQGDRERLIPFLPDDVVRRVDLDNGRIEVDWDPEF